MVTQFSRVQDYAEIKMRKKQALRTAPKLTNVYTGLFTFLPTTFGWEEKSKI